jgi:hypothetical protein
LNKQQLITEFSDKRLGFIIGRSTSESKVKSLIDMVREEFDIIP